MTYSASQAKAFGKRPVWLYEITLDGVTTYLAAKRNDYALAAQTYAAAVVGHSAIKQTGEIKRAQVTLTLPRTSALAQTARDTLDLVSTRVRVLHGYDDDVDKEFIVRFEGRIVSVKPLLGTISLVCESSFTAFRRKGIIPIIQRPCRHALYFSAGADGAGCPAVLANHQTDVSATAWADPVLTVADAALQADGFYAGGLIEYGGKFQMITKHEGQNLTLLNDHPSLTAEIASAGSATIKLARGCNRTMAQCAEINGDAAPHGGFPWMAESPFDGRLIY